MVLCRGSALGLHPYLRLFSLSTRCGEGGKGDETFRATAEAQVVRRSMYEGARMLDKQIANVLKYTSATQATHWGGVDLANTKSAEKRARQNEKRRLRNRLHKSRARTYVKKARLALAAGDLEAAVEAVRKAASMLDHAASKGAIHPNNAARRKSRLMKRLAQLQAQAQAQA